MIEVGIGLAGAAAAFRDLGYSVESFTFHAAPRRAHSVATQGAINAARVQPVDNDSNARFDKGGDLRGMRSRLMDVD